MIGREPGFHSFSKNLFLEKGNRNRENWQYFHNSDLARAVVNAIAYQWYTKWLETLERCPEQAFLATMGQLFAVQTLYENSSYLYDAGVLHERDLSKLQV